MDHAVNTRSAAPRPPAAVFDAPQVRGLRDEVMLAIERAILLGSLAPGQRLVEADIARQMGVSKAPVREALRCLEQLGLVVSHPRRGTFVTRLTATLASEAFSLRTLLETYAVRLIAPTITDSHLQQLATLLELDGTLPIDRGVVVDRDLAFHDLLFEIGGHRLLQQAWRNLRQQIRLLLTVTGILHASAEPGKPGNPPLTLAGVHAPILEALQHHDPDQAAAAIAHHLAMGERLLVQKLADGPGTPYVRPDLFVHRPARAPDELTAP
jgi:DNA-binding GntR family transcriptional regulator